MYNIPSVDGRQLVPFFERLSIERIQHLSESNKSAQKDKYALRIFTETKICNSLRVTNSWRFDCVKNEKRVRNVFVSAIDMPTTGANSFESFVDVVGDSHYCTK